MNIEFLGVIPMDNALTKSIMQQTPITISDPNCRSSKAFEDIAETLMNIPHESPIYKRGMREFFASFINR